jgi:hypothetical protein
MVAAMRTPAFDPHLPAPVLLFQRTFQELRPEAPFPYEQLYSAGVVFEDPLHRAEGVGALRAHFERLNSNLQLGQFEFGPTHFDDAEAVLSWTMRLQLRRGPRHPVVVSGLTQLRFDQRITHQRDHFDAGALVYEHLPVLGWLIRQVKRRL